MTSSTAPNGFMNFFDFFVFISIFVSPFSPCIYPSLYLCLSISPVYNPTVFRLVSLYKLLLYLNFRIDLERVKQKRRIWQIVVFLIEN